MQFDNIININLYRCLLQFFSYVLLLMLPTYIIRYILNEFGTFVLMVHVHGKMYFLQYQQMKLILFCFACSIHNFYQIIIFLFRFSTIVKYLSIGKYSNTF